MGRLWAPQRQHLRPVGAMLAPMSFGAARLVQVQTNPDDPSSQLGGCLIRPNMILTTASPLMRARRIYVRAEDGPAARALVLWARCSPRLDAALLQIDPGALPSQKLPKLRFGALDFGVSAPLSQGGTLRGMIGRYELLPSSHRTSVQAGTPLFVGELLVGIVAGDSQWACTLAQIVRSNLFARLVPEHSIHMIGALEARIRFGLKYTEAQERAERLTELAQLLGADGRNEERLNVEAEVSSLEGASGSPGAV